MGMWAANDTVDQNNIAEVGMKKLLFALSTGRVIGFVGSMATEDFGYGKWKEIVSRYHSLLVETFGSDCRDGPPSVSLLKAIRAEHDTTLGMDVVEDLFRQCYNGTSDEFDRKLGKARAAFSKSFSPWRGSEEDPEPRSADINIPRAIFRHLRLKRVMTLNYDVELELAALELAGNMTREEAIDKIRRRRSDHGNIHVALPNGTRILSQVVTRKRTDLLTEFAMGLPDRRVAVIHLHGRYDDPSSFVLTKDDYRRLYWRSGLSKTPVEHGLRSVFIGNPILCIGLGMSEADVNRTFEQFMSDTPTDTEFPRFLIWDNHRKRSGEFDMQKDAAFRLRMFRQLGVFVVFYGDLGVTSSRYKWLIKRRSFRSSVAPKLKPRSEPHSIVRESELKRIQRANLVEALCMLGVRADAYTANDLSVWNFDAFCIPSAKLGRGAFPLHDRSLTLWDPGDDIHRENGTQLSLYKPKSKIVKDPLKAIRETILSSSGKDLIAIVGSPGIGKGTLANRIHQTIAKDTKTNTRSVLVNAAFTMDSDGLAISLTGVLDGQTAFCKRISRAEAVRTMTSLAPRDLKAYYLGAAKAAQAIAGPTLIKEPDEIVIVLNGMGRFLGHTGDPLSIEIDSFIRGIAGAIKSKTEEPSQSGRSSSQGIRVRYILIGTERVRRYVKETFPGQFDIYRAEPCRDNHDGSENDGGSAATGDEEIYRVVVRPEGSLLAQTRKLHLEFTVGNDPDPDPDAGADSGKPVKKTWQRNYLAAVMESVLSNLGNSHDGEFQRARDELIKGITYIKSKAGKIDRKIRREAFAAILNPIAISRPDLNSDLLLFILQTMASVGQPMEWTVLRHPRRIRSLLAEQPSTVGSQDDYLRKHIEHLQTLKLIISVGPYDAANTGYVMAHVKDEKESPEAEDAVSVKGGRIALHKSVVAEFRERFGIRQSDAHLTNTFNLSLYASQPVDSHGPLPRTMRSLETLAGDLTHSYKDELHTELPSHDVTDLQRQLGKLGLVSLSDAEARRLASRETSACLRAAYTLLRSYYPISSLLMTSTDPSHRAPLQGLARILKRLIDIAEAHAVAYRIAQDSDEIEKFDIGTPPFHPDDIMWMYNEIGVVELILGRVYRAEKALDAAGRINRKFVEFGSRDQNWRRIQINRLNVLIDRGKLDQANAALERLRAAIDAAVESRSGCKPQGGTSDTSDGCGDQGLDRVVRSYGKPGVRSPHRNDPEFSKEIVLNTALYLGYRAILETLKGSFEIALIYFEQCLSVLSKIGERRAYALFQGHRVSVLKMMGRMDEAKEALKLSVNASSGIHHSDLNHLFRATILRSDKPDHAIVSSGTISQLRHSLAYAKSNRMYRIQIQILMLLSALHRMNTDFEAAIAADSEAVALSCRFGHGLRKVSLRNTMANNYILYSNPDFHTSAERLVASAIRIGTKIGYNTSVERSENLRVQMSGMPSRKSL